MSEQAKRGEGRAFRFVIAHQTYPHKDWCLIWPFTKVRGYGAFGYLGKRFYAHRYMCELVNGSAPSDVHEAAHSCGTAGCVNPNHLSWKTPAENGLDSRKHGTHVRTRHGPAGKITAEQAETIRSLKGVKKLWELAEEYGVSESAISNIWVGKTHSGPRILVVWSDEEDAVIHDGVSRGLSWAQMAKSLPRRTRMAVAARANRLGISNTPAYRKAET